VLGNSTIVTCSPTEYPELFQSFAGSHGTLGVVALAGVECDEAGGFRGGWGGKEQGAMMPVMWSWARRFCLTRAFEHPKFFDSPPFSSTSCPAPTVCITYTLQNSIEEGVATLKRACKYPRPPPVPSSLPGPKEIPDSAPHFVDAVLYRERSRAVGDVSRASQVREGGREGRREEGKEGE